MAFDECDCDSSFCEPIDSGDPCDPNSDLYTGDPCDCGPISCDEDPPPCTDVGARDECGVCNGDGSTCAKPCKSTDGKRANPLKNMKILPTPGDIAARNSKPVNGNFGGRSGRHKGVDLDAIPGTPIFAPHDGKLVNKIVNSWPNDNGTNKWSDTKAVRQLAGQDSNEGGNRFYIESTINNVTYWIGFFHIQKDGIENSLGDEIKQGDIIGYTGKTGSAQASGSGGPHLHIEYWKNKSPSNKVDPKDFMQSNFDEFGNTKNPCN